jgi:hypothetical protein
MQNRHKNYLLAIMAAAPMVLLGCGASPEESGTSESSNPATATLQPLNISKGTINGKLLYAIKPASGHVVEFYEFSQGNTAVRESLLVDSGAPLTEAIAHDVTLGQAFQLINPGAQVPKVLQDADKRTADFRKSLPPTDPNAPVTSQESTEDKVAAGAITPLSQAAGGTCSDDYYGDGWGGQWFLNNYCNEGQLRACEQNIDYKGWTVTNYSWFRWKQMEGDFNVAGHTTGIRAYKPCSWPWACGDAFATDWDYDVQPRHIEIWTWSNANDGHIRWAQGWSNCWHLHYARLLNN